MQQVPVPVQRVWGTTHTHTMCFLKYCQEKMWWLRLFFYDRITTRTVYQRVHVPGATCSTRGSTQIDTVFYNIFYIDTCAHTCRVNPCTSVRSHLDILTSSLITLLLPLPFEK